MVSADLWVERHRPATLDGYVFKNEHNKELIKSWVENPDKKAIPFPHLLLSGSPGTGKTTLAKALLNQLGVNKYDILELNGSRENSVDTVREKIVGFCTTYPVGDYKVVFIDEADYLSQSAQAILRNELERFADSVRFILTCNYPHKIIPAMHSRMQGLHFDALDMEGFITRLLEILTLENVQFNMDDLDPYISNSYPDLRKCINLLDQHTSGGVLRPLQEGTASSLNYMGDAVELFKKGKFTDARKLITSNADVNDYEEVFRFLYKNLQIFSTDLDVHNALIVIIARGLRNHAVCADAEINLAATIIEMSQTV